MMSTDSEDWLANNADPTRWSWPAANEWRHAGVNWQTFYSKWRNTPTTEDPTDVATLSTLSPGNPLFSDFVVRDEYKRMIEKVLFHAWCHPSNGVLVTGQPGVGKTQWLRYLLICLLFKKQSVLFTWDKSALLFHQGTVYSKNGTVQHGDLPYPDSNHLLLWTLIDTDGIVTQVPGYLYGLHCFPIHAASPNPDRFSVWVKKKTPAVFGFVEWDIDELFAGLVLQPDYESFLEKFQLYAGLAVASTLPAPLDKLDQHRHAHEILQKWEASCELQQATFLTDDQQTLALTVDKALKILLRAAAEEFGRAPRDVYEAIFNPVWITKTHQSALFDVRYDELFEVVRELQRSKTYPNSKSLTHLIVSIYPDQSSELDWKINFKSPNIARKALDRMEECEKDRDIEVYRRFKSSKEASAMAGWLFESIANKQLASGNLSDCVLFPMANSGTDDSPILSIDFSNDNLVSTTNLSLPIAKMNITAFSGRVKNPLVLMNRFYRPEASSNPLFDAFFAVKTVDDESETVYIDLWVFQHTISRSRRCSDLGYPLIRKIIRGLENPFQAGVNESKRKLSVCTSVHYVLVVPEDDDNDVWEWIMPAGYSTETHFQDHRGDFYCLRLPLMQREVATDRELGVLT
ncbi:hypothetical protein VKT23_011477 [Stygiomarasmius scandens]|uniref:Uncharacterized protein n=1 Tax=Marasmiellus scandens TaxID=2682957 RepID=A0ABR1J990_9AGAR